MPITSSQGALTYIKTGISGYNDWDNWVSWTTSPLTGQGSGPVLATVTGSLFYSNDSNLYFTFSRASFTELEIDSSGQNAPNTEYFKSYNLFVANNGNANYNMDSRYIWGMKSNLNANNQFIILSSHIDDNIEVLIKLQANTGNLISCISTYAQELSGPFVGGTPQRIPRDFIELGNNIITIGKQKTKPNGANSANSDYKTYLNIFDNNSNFVARKDFGNSNNENIGYLGPASIFYSNANTIIFCTNQPMTNVCIVNASANLNTIHSQVNLYYDGNIELVYMAGAHDGVNLYAVSCTDYASANNYLVLTKTDANNNLLYSKRTDSGYTNMYNFSSVGNYQGANLNICYNNNNLYVTLGSAIWNFDSNFGNLNYRRAIFPFTISNVNISGNNIILAGRATLDIGQTRIIASLPSNGFIPGTGNYLLQNTNTYMTYTEIVSNATNWIDCTANINIVTSNFVLGDIAGTRYFHSNVPSSTIPTWRNTSLNN